MADWVVQLLVSHSVAAGVKTTVVECIYTYILTYVEFSFVLI